MTNATVWVILSLILDSGSNLNLPCGETDRLWRPVIPTESVQRKEPTFFFVLVFELKGVAMATVCWVRTRIRNHVPCTHTDVLHSTSTILQWSRGWRKEKISRSTTTAYGTTLYLRKMTIRKLWNLWNYYKAQVAVTLVFGEKDNYSRKATSTCTSTIL